MPIPAGSTTDYPTFTAVDLSDFSGRPEASYTPFATQALKQATLLFKLATCLTSWPTDPDSAELASYAIISIADALVLTQPYQLTHASPFQSESIGSYSYSKMVLRYRQSIENGSPVGVTWFDLAVQKLGICELGGLNGGGGVASDSIGVFEEDGTFGTKDGDDSGKRYLLGPAQVDNQDDPFLVSQNISSETRTF
jgi:hypothetical protein